MSALWFLLAPFHPIQSARSIYIHLGPSSHIAIPYLLRSFVVRSGTRKTWGATHIWMFHPLMYASFFVFLYLNGLCEANFSAKFLTRSLYLLLSGHNRVCISFCHPAVPGFGLSEAETMLMACTLVWSCACPHKQCFSHKIYKFPWHDNNAIREMPPREQRPAQFGLGREINSRTVSCWPQNEEKSRWDWWADWARSSVVVPDYPSQWCKLNGTKCLAKHLFATCRRLWNSSDRQQAKWLKKYPESMLEIRQQKNKNRKFWAGVHGKQGARSITCSQTFSQSFS